MALPSEPVFYTEQQQGWMLARLTPALGGLAYTGLTFWTVIAGHERSGFGTSRTWCDV